VNGGPFRREFLTSDPSSGKPSTFCVFFSVVTMSEKNGISPVSSTEKFLLQFIRKTVIGRKESACRRGGPSKDQDRKRCFGFHMLDLRVTVAVNHLNGKKNASAVSTTKRAEGKPACQLL